MFDQPEIGGKLGLTLLESLEFMESWHVSDTIGSVVREYGAMHPLCDMTSCWTDAPKEVPYRKNSVYSLYYFFRRIR